MKKTDKPTIKKHDIIVCIPTTPGRRERLKDCIAAIKQNSGNVDYDIFTFENELGGWVAATRAMLAKLPSDQLVIVIGDDCLPRENWLKPLVETFNKHFPEGVGLCQPDDGVWGGAIASYPCSTAGYLLRWIYSGYKHYHSDEEIAMLARARGHYRYVPASVVFHNDSSKDETLWDETYEKESKSGEADKELFFERRERARHYHDFWEVEWD